MNCPFAYYSLAQGSRTLPEQGSSNNEHQLYPIPVSEQTQTMSDIFNFFLPLRSICLFIYLSVCQVISIYIMYNTYTKLTLHEKCPDRRFFWYVFFCIHTEYRKIQTRKNPYLDNFQAVLPLLTASSFNFSITISYSSSLPNFAHVFLRLPKSTNH